MQKVRTNQISKKGEFNPKRVEKASSAAKELCEWVLALDEKYLQSQQEVARLTEQLRILQQDLSVLTQEINTLETLYQDTIEIKKCEIKLQRARKLMEGLGGEGERWSQSSALYDTRLKQILGDIILASGVVAYLDVFSNEY